MRVVGRWRGVGEGIMLADGGSRGAAVSPGLLAFHRVGVRIPRAAKREGGRQKLTAGSRSAHSSQISDLPYPIDGPKMAPAQQSGGRSGRCCRARMRAGGQVRTRHSRKGLS